MKRLALDLSSAVELPEECRISLIRIAVLHTFHSFCPMPIASL